MLNHLKINQKLSFSNAVGFSIVFLGIVSGIFIGYRLQYQAKIKLDTTLRDGRLMREFQTNFLEVESHRKGLSTLLNQPEELAQLYGEYNKDSGQLSQLWYKLKIVAEEPCTSKKQECQILQNIISTHDTSMQKYFKQPKLLSQKIDLLNLQPTDIANAQNIVNKFTSDTVLVKNIFDFVEEFENLIEINAEKIEKLEIDFAQAIELQTKILISSLLLSVAIAALLTAYISRGITKPLEASTQVAQQVSQNDDFSLRVPIMSQDEVGILATTLNQLIERVQKLLKERQAAETQLIQSEKMSSLGQMVAGIAHEINNPVTFIQGNIEHAREYNQDLLNLIELYQKYYPQPPEEIDEQIENIELDYLKSDSQQLFESMQNGSERIRKIILSLRNFSRLDEADCKKVHIHEGIDSTLLILHSRLQTTSKYPEIKIIQEYGSLPLVECYPSQLNQALMNILINAIDALYEYNEQRTIEEIKLNPNCIHITTEVIDENWIKIKIADNGIGIPKNILPKLFDPFFTTKEVGQGTGLGLSVSYQIIVDNHGGKLSCQSTYGQ
ncbi:MAG: ATP-binding protein [Calothrix sp. MO_167.B42]|nr:ATP-binding protein [Calothrix sp. MO_167.B42]